MGQPIHPMWFHRTRPIPFHLNGYFFIAQGLQRTAINEAVAGEDRIGRLVLSNNAIVAS
ncbi:MAG: hypothetical protein IPO22_14600 [Anaerolineales bacterium]|nr:hypothetical protein [Anaerolineales bacterium]